MLVSQQNMFFKVVIKVCFLLTSSYQARYTHPATHDSEWKKNKKNIGFENVHSNTVIVQLSPDYFSNKDKTYKDVITKVLYCLI